MSVEETRKAYRILFTDKGGNLLRFVITPQDQTQKVLEGWRGDIVKQSQLGTIYIRGEKGIGVAHVI